MVDDVFHSVARRYDLMNDLMSVGLHRAWKDALVTAVDPPRNRPFALLDLAGGTGDVAFRVIEAGGAQTRVTVCDINADMLAVGRERAARASARRAVTFVEANAEALPFADRSFDAVTIAFGIRNVPRIEAALAEAFRVLKIGGKFLCLEFSAVDVPGLDRLYELYSFNVIPALGRVVAGDAEAYRYLVESIRRFPRRRAFAAMMRGAGFARVSFKVDDRRHRGAAFRLALVISGPAHLIRLARAGFVFAREGVFGVDRSGNVPAPARIALRARAPHRAAEPRHRGEAAVGGADPARADLCEARPVPGDAAGRGRRRAGARSGTAAGPDGAVPAGRSGARGRGGVGQTARRGLRALRAAGRGRLDRAGPPRRSGDAGEARRARSP